MGRPRILDENILKKIAIKRGYPEDLTRVRKLVSSKAHRNNISSKVALVLVAKDEGIGTQTFQKKLGDGEKSELQRMLSQSSTVQSRVPRSRKLPKKRKMEEIVNYSTYDHFIKGHIDELNRAYNSGCLTCVFILARKIVENLVIDILKKKYPQDIEFYFDKDRGRTKDFNVVLKKLYEKRGDFGSERKIVETLYKKAKALKDDANDKAHSWYHLVETKQEIKDLSLQAIVELIIKLELIVGIR